MILFQENAQTDGRTDGSTDIRTDRPYFQYFYSMPDYRDTSLES